MAFNNPGLNTPQNCTADFSLIPIGSQNVSFSKQVADIQRLMQSSGLKYQMHATGTIIEGSWEEVSRIIGYAHSLIHQEGIPRIQTDIRIITRTDKVQPMEANVLSVQRALST
ncbi:cell wall biogenesis protein [Aspergillus ellipticus CBS 707.79]|uniref:Cell wall biogenesis protein n=1 Tax=Aspergillus ellipticus CBS 707.79 TaxID=1448320 RepID=A0A319D3C3_9EURO|nr:cell wall biogenesis protein [Aspergillus ellipticus CBS 707.79]